MCDIMSNNESSLWKLQLSLYSTLIAELNLIIFSGILIGLNFAPPALADSGRQDCFCSTQWELNCVTMHQLDRKMDRGAALEHWEGALLSQLTWYGDDTVKCTKSFVTCWTLQSFWNCLSFSCHQDIRVGVPLIFWTLKDSVLFPVQCITDWCKEHGLVFILRYSQY